MRVVALYRGARLVVVNGEWSVSGSGEPAERLRDIASRVDEVLDELGPSDGGPAHVLAEWLREQGLDVTTVRDRPLPRGVVP